MVFGVLLITYFLLVKPASTGSAFVIDCPIVGSGWRNS
jgi:hypothetical protein